MFQRKLNTLNQEQFNPVMMGMISVFSPSGAGSKDVHEGNRPSEAFSKSLNLESYGWSADNGKLDIRQRPDALSPQDLTRFSNKAEDDIYHPWFNNCDIIICCVVIAAATRRQPSVSNYFLVHGEDRV